MSESVAEAVSLPPPPGSTWRWGLCTNTCVCVCGGGVINIVRINWNQKARVTNTHEKLREAHWTHNT